MYHPLLVLKQPGPKVTEGSAKVYRDGLTLRLSSDILRKLLRALAPPKAIRCGVDSIHKQRKNWTFYPFVDTKNKILKLQTRKTGSEVSEITGWYPHKKNGRSLLINIRSVMDVMGFSAVDTPGEYETKIVGTSIEILFGKRLR